MTCCEKLSFGNDVLEPACKDEKITSLIFSGDDGIR